MKAILKENLEALFNFFYPEVCLSCTRALLRNEKILCWTCDSDMPRTNHFEQPDNELYKRFTGRIELQAAAAMFHFSKESGVQHLLHALKYKGRQDAGEYAGRLIAYKIKSSTGTLQTAEVIVPVPLHWKKQKIRGYNQCDSVANAIAAELQIPFNNQALERTHANISQTRKSRFDRWGNVAEIFAVKNPALLEGKHVLLVDDVVTTGATAEACLQTIAAYTSKVSFVAIAAAQR